MQAYEETAPLYYQQQPTFDDILQAIRDLIEML